MRTFGDASRRPFWAVLLVMTAGFALRQAEAVFYGDGTYYGDNGWAGSCQGNIRWAGGVYDASSWPPAGGQFGTRVALNSRQYSTAMCGKRLMFRGTGAGLGGSPISTTWQEGMVTNLCPECQYGDLDLGIGGDGRWKIEWYWVDDDSAGLRTESAHESERAVARKSWQTVWDKLRKQNSRQSKAKMKRLVQNYWAKKHGGRKLLHTSAV